MYVTSTWDGHDHEKRSHIRRDPGAPTNRRRMRSNTVVMPFARTNVSASAQELLSVVLRQPRSSGWLCPCPMCPMAPMSSRRRCTAAATVPCMLLLRDGVTLLRGASRRCPMTRRWQANAAAVPRMLLLRDGFTLLREASRRCPMTRRWPANAAAVPRM